VGNENLYDEPETFSEGIPLSMWMANKKHLPNSPGKLDFPVLFSVLTDGGQNEPQNSLIPDYPDKHCVFCIMQSQENQPNNPSAHA
jgi:hypothetical protein